MSPWQREREKKPSVLIYYGRPSELVRWLLAAVGTIVFRGISLPSVFFSTTLRRTRMSAAIPLTSLVTRSTVLKPRALTVWYNTCIFDAGTQYCILARRFGTTCASLKIRYDTFIPSTRIRRDSYRIR